MSTIEKVTVAIIGLGVGEQHARMFASLPQCEVKWLYDLDAGRAEALAAHLSGSRVAGSYEQILDDPQVQIVSLASFDDDHYAQTLAALQAGKHVFVEKPLCRTVEELSDIYDAWNRYQGKIKLSSNLVLRAAPLYRWLREEIGAGNMGQLYALDGDYLYGRLHKITQGWRKDVHDYSVMLGGGVHMVDLMLWFSGQRPETVTAAGNRISTGHSEFKYNDFVAMTMHFPSGMIGRITANFGCVQRHQHAIRIFGTQRAFYYDDAGARMHTTRDPAMGASSVDLSPLPENKGDLIPEFVSNVINDADMNQHTRQIFDTISICAACDEAVHKNSQIEVQYV